MLATGVDLLRHRRLGAALGIEYRDRRAERASCWSCSASVAAVIAPFARPSVAFEVAGGAALPGSTHVLLCLAGLLGIAITGDAFNAFVFLEISSLSTYVLIALGRDRRALLAAYQYLIMGTIGATFIVIGVGLLYLVTGTLNMRRHRRAPRRRSSRRARCSRRWPSSPSASSLKLALFPLHVWLPNAYAYAPSWVTAFLAATATKVAIYLLLRFYFSVFGVAFVFGALPIADIIMVLSVAAMFMASVARCSRPT